VGERITAAAFYMGPNEPDNSFQQALHAAAREAAGRLDITYEGFFAAGSAGTQVGQFLTAIRRPEAERPQVVMLMPVNDEALKRALRDAMKRGIACVLVHRTTDAFADLRAEGHPGPLAAFCPDQKAIGPLHAEQCRRLLPRGGGIVLVRGPRHVWSSLMRAEGFKAQLDTVPGATLTILDEFHADWSRSLAAAEFERLVTRWRDIPLDVVVCANDEMAAGIIEIRAALAQRVNRPELALLPVLGCDGLTAVGRRMVDDGRLKATIAQELATPAALHAAAGYLRRREAMSADNALTVESYPALGQLSPVRA
jgi:ABC-type sugar transport system substrate-binding protein